MARSQHKRAGKRDRSGAVVAILSGFLLTGAVLAGVALLFPDLVADLNIVSSSSDSTTTTEPVPADDAQSRAGESLDSLVTALESVDLTGIRFANGAVGAASSTTVTSIESEDRSTTGSASTTPATQTTVEAAEPSAEFGELTAGMGSFTIDATAGVVTVIDAENASAPIDLLWSLPGGFEWETTGDVDLMLVGDSWMPVWSPSILESSLAMGDRLFADRLAPTRAPILAGDGSVLVDEIALVEIGVQPSRVEDLPSLAQRLEELVGADAVDLAARVRAASPDAFVEVATLPRAEYDAIRAEIFPLPGTVFKESTRPASADSNFARALLGRSGEVTADIIEQFPGLYEAGDYAGISGVQKTFNEVLTGQPGIEVAVVRAARAPGPTTTGTGLITTSSVVEIGAPQVLFSVPATDGETVQLTIDPVMQRAAERSLQRTELTSALVVIQVSTGDVVALANGPTGNTVNFAMTGQYPPGSIFKVISGYTILRDSLDARDAINCPQTITVSGRSFANAENEVLGTVDFRSAFAHSCNTAFVGATLGFELDVLNRAATDFGVGVDYNLGEPSFSGSVPVNTDEVDLAAAAFGQGRVLVSPLSAAVMASTAADGAFRSPRLVASPGPGEQVVSPLEPAAADSLRELMRAVVTEGTGRAVARVSGPPVSGKTGTAEFGNNNPPQSHAWFVGYQGDLAFAAFVEAGEFGGSTAAPIVADFLNQVAG